MKTKVLILATVGLILMLVASLAAAQSLGDVARQERQKRAKETKKPVKVVTNEDFPAPPPAEEAKPAAPSSASEETPAESAEQPAAQPTEQPAAQTTAEEAAAPPSTEEQKPEDKQKTREYWQGRFRAAKQRIADAEELQRLAEDELSLLQIQQARELSPDGQADLEARVKAKNAELETRRATTAKARKALENLEKEFKESGAPTDWSKTD